MLLFFPSAETTKMSCDNNGGSSDVDSVAKINGQPEAAAIDGVTPTRLLK